jgi:tetratricopeptide (TPR) repeat protein
MVSRSRDQYSIARVFAMCVRLTLICRLLLCYLLFAVALWPAKTWAQEAAPAAAPEQTQITIDDLRAAIGNAEQMVARGEFEQALQEFSKYTPVARQAQFSDNADSYKRVVTGQAMALIGLQEYAEAIELFKEVLDIDENFAGALIGRGNLYLQLNAPNAAYPDFQKAVKASRANPVAQIDALFGLGKSLALLQQYDAAIAPLSKVIAEGQNANIAEALRHRGTAYGGLDKFALAMADLEQSLSMNPDAHETYSEIGIINLRKKEYQTAADDFGRSIAKYKPPKGREDEPYAQGYLVKASAHIEAGKVATDPAVRAAAYQSAIDEAQQLYSLVDEESRYTAGIRAAALLSRGIGERMAGKLNLAIRTMSQALELNPAASEAYFRRGICLLEIGEEKMAIADFVQAAAINFEDPRNNLWEGFVYAKMGDYHEAIRAYGDAIAASDRFTPAYVNRGLAYMMLGEDEKAIADFNDALRIEPTNGDYFYKRGVAYAQLGRLEEASKSLASAIEFAPKHREAYRQMGVVQERLGRKELAEQYRKKAAELDAAKAPNTL